MAIRQFGGGIGQAGFGDLRVQHIVAQVLAHHHAFEAGFRFEDLAGLGVGRHVQRQGRHRAPASSEKALMMLSGCMGILSPGM